METHDIKVKIIQRPATLLDEIYLYRDIGGGILEYITFHENGKVLMTTVNTREATESTISPAIVCFSNLSRKIVQAFVDEGKIIGVEMPNESKAKGMLEAQTRHLEDLRTMLKLK